MSGTITSLPSGSNVNAVAEHRQPRGRDKNQHESAPPEDEGKNDHPDTTADQQRLARPAPSQSSATPGIDKPGFPPETLFEIALLANGLPPSLPSPDEMKLRASHTWLPPDSILRLKDKLI